MRSVVERVVRAIDTHEPIMVHGDYDADGVTSTVLLVEVLRTWGADVDWFIPDRYVDGYGLRIENVDRFADQGKRLLICIDCGTSNIQEIQRARERQMDVIVMDHHHATEIPDALMLNPNIPGETYPFRGHSSAGVAFTFIRAFVSTATPERLAQSGIKTGWEKWLLDLVAISTVADLMVLQDENRVLVTYGLKVLRKTRRPGLRALLTRIGASGSGITEQTIGFQIAPRLNAAGRLKHARTAVQLLLTADIQEAATLVDELEQINADRQRLTAAAVDEAWDHIRQREAGGYALYAPHWSAGVLGLIAGRIADKVWKPVAVMTEVDGETVGSVRSVAGLDIMPILQRGAHFFQRYGGHPGAGGFTVQPGQREAFQEWFEQEVTRASPAPVARPLDIDAIVTVKDMDSAALHDIESFAPFGAGSARPIFMIAGLRADPIKFAGNDQQHIRVTAADPSGKASFIGFRQRHLADVIQNSPGIDIVVEPSWNVWNGRSEVQLRIIDIRPST